MCPRKYRYLVLLLFSMLFYSYSGIENLVLIVVTALFNFFIARYFYKAKSLLYIGLIVDVGVLAFFKYNGNFALPLGISFYTFNNITYLIDVYNYRYMSEDNPLKYLTYALMFPTVSMGPLSGYAIVYDHFDELGASFDETADGLKRFIKGLVFKVLIGDNLAALYASLTGETDKSVLLLITTIIIYGIQLYVDFSSYSDMAIGLGKMMGIEYKENFNYPYMALSVSDFWRRWHMTLTNFFTRYIYIPMGGNKVKWYRHIFNILVVWCLTGIWHGSTLNFVLWGLYYFVILTVEKYLLNNLLNKTNKIIRNIYVLIVVFVGYIFFSTGSLAGLKEFFSSLNTSPFFNSNLLFYLKENYVWVIAGILACIEIPEDLKENKWFIAIADVLLLLLFVLAIAYILSGNFHPFLYSAF